MSDFVHTLAGYLAGWNSIYSDSKPVATAVTGTHLLALLFGGGLAFSADRRILLGALKDPATRFRYASELSAMHRSIIIAIVVIVISGLAQAASDVESFLVSPIFWSKMGLFLALLANGAFIRSDSDAMVRDGAQGAPRTPRLIRRLRRGALFSITLWSLTLILGTALSIYA